MKSCIFLTGLIIAPIWAYPALAEDLKTDSASEDKQTVQKDQAQTLSNEKALEIAKDKQGREKLKKLIELYESGSINEEEYNKKIDELKIEHSLKKAPNPCEGITCSGKGVCSVYGGKPRCECSIEGFEPDVKTGLDCVPRKPEPGWSKSAAIAGLVAAPATAMLTFSAFGARTMEKDNLSIALQAADISIVGLMGVTVAVGAYSARRSALVTGDPYMRLGANVFYGASLMIGVVTISIQSGDKSASSWPVLLWGGAGSISLLLHSIDAAKSYWQAVNLTESSNSNSVKRPWTWTAMITGGAATIGAVVAGVSSLKKKDAIENMSSWDLLCEDKVEGSDNSSCKVVKAEIELRKRAAVTDILIGAAATGFAVGTALYFIEPMLQYSNSGKALSFTPYVSPEGAGLVLEGRF